jgi:hypothetical protein
MFDLRQIAKLFVFKLHTRMTSFYSEKKQQKRIEKSINALVHAHGEIKFIRLMFERENGVGKGS